jgi:hypothetical protein
MRADGAGDLGRTQLKLTTGARQCLATIPQQCNEPKTSSPLGFFW